MKGVQVLSLEMISHARVFFRESRQRDGRIFDSHGVLQLMRDDLHGGRFATCYL